MKQLEIIDELGNTCPYCFDQYRGRISCCGEASTHGERGYVVKMEDGSEENKLESELEIEGEK